LSCLKLYIFFFNIHLMNWYRLRLWLPCGGSERPKVDGPISIALNITCLVGKTLHMLLPRIQIRKLFRGRRVTVVLVMSGRRRLRLRLSCSPWSLTCTNGKHADSISNTCHSMFRLLCVILGFLLLCCENDFLCFSPFYRLHLVLVKRVLFYSILFYQCECIQRIRIRIH